MDGMQPLFLMEWMKVGVTDQSDCELGLCVLGRYRFPWVGRPSSLAEGRRKERGTMIHHTAIGELEFWGDKFSPKGRVRSRVFW